MEATPTSTQHTQAIIVRSANTTREAIEFVRQFRPIGKLTAKRIDNQTFEVYA